jgi:prepilin-type N-terminal cleavage/methylation domain-containing protein
MSCYFNMRGIRKKGFSLIEVLTALAILALISSSVLVVIDRGTASAADSMLRMEAFEVARENMEELLSSTSVKESIDSGQSDQYPDITWQTAVESFYEPITSRMWIRGVCSATYNDPNGQEQTVKLEHWLTDLTKDQLLQMMKQDGQDKTDVSNELIPTLDEAAQYAGVDVETIQQWLDNGLLTLEDGSFVKSNLDIYIRSNGNPSENQKEQQVKSKAELENKTTQSGKGADAGQQQKDEIDPKTGLTYGQLDQMDFSQIWDLMKSRTGGSSGSNELKNTKSK